MGRSNVCETGKPNNTIGLGERRPVNRDDGVGKDKNIFRPSGTPS